MSTRRPWRATILLGVALGTAGAWWVVRSRQAESPSARIERAWQRVLEQPRSVDAWVRLGDLQAEVDDPVAAEHTYQTATRLGGRSPIPHERLGFLLYARGRDGEALRALDRAKALGSTDPMVSWTATQLGERPAPARAPRRPVLRAPEPARAAPVTDTHDTPAAPVVEAPEPEAEADGEPAAPEDCEVPVHRAAHGRSYLVGVVVDGAAGTLIVDTGASMTVLTRDFADRAGLDPDPEQIIHAITASGRAEFPVAAVEAFDLGGRSVAHTRVALCEDCVEDVADGLLGMDVQAELGLQLDLAGGAVRFGDCE